MINTLSTKINSSMKNSLLLSIIFLFFSCQNNEIKELKPFENLTNKVDHYANNTILNGNINSLAIGVYKNGKSYYNYYGVMSQLTKNDSTLFEIASISKVFVGSLVARAVEEGHFSINDDIRIFFPGTFSNLEFNGTPITVQNIVTHTLGFETPPKLDSIYQLIFDGYYENKDIPYSMIDLFAELETVSLTTKPGTYYDYNNVGPEIAAYILEQVYEQPYELILNQFLKEIGLKNTYLQDFISHKRNLAPSYNEFGELATIDKNPLLGGAAGIISTLPDLMQFMHYLLNSTDPLIKESTKVLFKEEEVGYFWNLGTAKKEGFYYYKTGTSSGVQSGLLVCPDSDYGQIIIMNNISEEAFDDWESLYNKIEYDLIEFPKINLWTQLESEFFKSPIQVSEQFIKLSKDTSKYFLNSTYLNNIGYSHLYKKEHQKAIEVFKLALKIDPDNANLFDSLGEAYYLNEEYENAKENFIKSLSLNPKNQNAATYIQGIDSMLVHQ
jgi:CubicO group peptidase (beta-lactamase class C family)